MGRTKDEIAKQIDADIEEMDSWEKKCALWMLLRWYDAKEMEVPMEPDTVEEYKEYVFMRDVKVTINHLIELLGFDIWRQRYENKSYADNIKYYFLFVLCVFYDYNIRSN